MRVFFLKKIYKYAYMCTFKKNTYTFMRKNNKYTREEIYVLIIHITNIINIRKQVNRVYEYMHTIVKK